MRAQSTIGTFLRSFTHGHARQLAKVNRVRLRRVIGQVPALAGTPGGLVMADVDSTIREVDGYQKQAAAFGILRGPSVECGAGTSVPAITRTITSLVLSPRSGR